MACLCLVAADTELGEDHVLGAFVVIGHDGDGPPVRIGTAARIRSHSVLYRGVTAGSNLQTGHGVLIRDACALGDNVSIGSHSVVEHHVVIEDDVRIHSSCFVPELSILRRGSWLGPRVTVTNARYPNRPDTKSQLEGVEVGEGAVIGAAAVLLPGVKLGARCLVGAGAVVTADVKPGQVVVGNPARPL